MIRIAVILTNVARLTMFTSCGVSKKKIVVCFFLLKIHCNWSYAVHHTNPTFIKTTYFF